jgi:hypothetical protein
MHSRAREGLQRSTRLRLLQRLDAFTPVPVRLRMRDQDRNPYRNSEYHKHKRQKTRGEQRLVQPLAADRLNGARFKILLP